VFIAVENENDNTPLTVEPVYYPSIPENSPAGKVVVELKAEDHDLDPTQRLTYRITAGNPGGFFSINFDTGWRITSILSSSSSSSSSSFLGSTAQLRPWPPPQNPAGFLGGFSTIFFFTG
jgi:protocadherin Fat 1/2/3